MTFILYTENSDKPSGNPVLGDKLLPSETDACSLPLAINASPSPMITFFESCFFPRELQNMSCLGRKKHEAQNGLLRDLFSWATIKGTGGSFEANADRSIFSMRGLHGIDLCGIALCFSIQMGI